MKFSIVTPCFNATRYLPDTLASVRHALADRAYEHVITDGCSTDGTVELLRQHPDLSWISEPDKSMYEALNKSIARASGDVIGHLNTDEQYNRAGLQEALDLLERDPSIDAVFGSTIMLDRNGDFLQLTKQAAVPRVIDTHWHMPVQSCSLLYRKHVWEREPYDESYRLVSDHLWFRHQMERGMKLALVSQPIGIFIWHPDNLSSSEGKTSNETAIGDIDCKSLRIQMAKRAYRLRKWLGGGYSRTPVTYEQFRNGKLETHTVKRPVLKIRKHLSRLQ